MQAEDRVADEERQSGTGEQEVSGQTCTPSSETWSTIVATTFSGTPPLLKQTVRQLNQILISSVCMFKIPMNETLSMPLKHIAHGDDSPRYKHSFGKAGMPCPRNLQLAHDTLQSLQLHSVVRHVEKKIMDPRQ